MRQRYLHHVAYGRRVIGLAAGLLLAACGPGPEPGVDPDDPRKCDPKPGMNWVELGFQAVVTQPETCPIALDTRPQMLPLEGDVWFPDFFGSNPNLGVDRQVRVVDDDGFTQKLIDLPFDVTVMNFESVWFAHVMDDYSAGAGFFSMGTDTLVFEVDVFTNNGFLDVRGRVDLPYSVVPRMAISGPASVSPQNIVEIDVNVENGTLPLTYKWYHNNALVQTNVVNSYFNSYTTFGLAEGTHTFDCVVTDADGDGNNKTLIVESSAGGGGPGF